MKLGYTISLSEKPMYNPAGAANGAAEAGAAVDGIADLVNAAAAAAAVGHDE